MTKEEIRVLLEAMWSLENLLWVLRLRTHRTSISTDTAFVCRYVPQ